MGEQAERVVIGMDPHKRSATIEVMTANEDVLGEGRFDTDEPGFAAMTDYVNRVQPDRDRRVWAVEGCNGIGHHIAVRLLAAGEQVVDVPPTLSARTRVFATGQGRKTDATDARSVALVGTRMAGLDRWSMTSSSPSCGSWPTGAVPWVRTTPGSCPSCTSTCSS